MADLRAEYEISQKQIEIDLLEKGRTVNRLVLVFVLVFVLVLFVLVYLLFKNNGIIKKQKETLVQQKSKLQDINRNKDKMFSIVSHDLRGPIHAMSGFLPLMDDLVMNKDTDDLLEMSVHMNQSLQNISSLLDNLLEWALNEQGQLSYKPEKFNIHHRFSLFMVCV